MIQAVYTPTFYPRHFMTLPLLRHFNPRTLPVKTQTFHKYNLFLKALLITDIRIPTYRLAVSFCRIMVLILCTTRVCNQLICQHTYNIVYVLTKILWLLRKGLIRVSESFGTEPLRQMANSTESYGLSKLKNSKTPCLSSDTTRG